MEDSWRVHTAVCFPTFVGARMLSDASNVVQTVMPHRDMERETEKKLGSHFCSGDVLHYAPGAVAPQAIIASSQETEVERLLQDQTHLRLCKFSAYLVYNMTSKDKQPPPEIEKLSSKYY